MCDERSCFITCDLWQVAQSSTWVAFTSCPFPDFGLCTEWHVVHPRLRAACALPSHIACSERLWHVTQVSLTRPGAILVNFLM